MNTLELNSNEKRLALSPNTMSLRPEPQSLSSAELIRVMRLCETRFKPNIIAERN